MRYDENDAAAQQEFQPGNQTREASGAVNGVADASAAPLELPFVNGSPDPRIGDAEDEQMAMEVEDDLSLATGHYSCIHKTGNR